MTHKYPKYNETRLTSEKGVTIVKKTIEFDFGWIFRQTPLEHDFGIDGYIDIINKDNYITGKSIAVQIKTGQSYFKNKTTNGWSYIGERKHLNYYLNLNNPVLLLLVDPESEKVYWEEFDPDKISHIKDGWRISIEKRKIFNHSQKIYLQSLPGFEIDYLPQLEYQWAVDEEIKKSGIILLAVDKSEIDQKNFEGFKILLKRLTSSDDMVKICKGRISFVLFGYEEDDRELYQIPEVREWAKSIIPIFKYWGYYLNMDSWISILSGLRILHLCSVDIEVLGKNENSTGYLVGPNKEQTLNLMNKLFIWLNEFAASYNISEEVIRERSNSIANILFDFNK